MFTYCILYEVAKCIHYMTKSAEVAGSRNQLKKDSFSDGLQLHNSTTTQLCFWSCTAHHHSLASNKDQYSWYKHHHSNKSKLYCLHMWCQNKGAVDTSESYLQIELRILKNICINKKVNIDNSVYFFRIPNHGYAKWKVFSHLSKFIMNCFLKVLIRNPKWLVTLATLIVY